MRSAVAAVALAAACSGSPAPQTPDVTGTLLLDDKATSVTACRAGRTLKTYVELVTNAGKLRFEDGALYWSADPEPILRGAKLDCTQLDRAWGGGYRLDGTAYFKAWTFKFACKPANGAAGPTATGDLQLACGGITAEEHAQLDQNRADHKKSQGTD